MVFFDLLYVTISSILFTSTPKIIILPAADEDNICVVSSGGSHCSAVTFNNGPSISAPASSALSGDGIV